MSWTALHEELRIWRAEQLDLPLWWRDDDAVAHSAALDELLALAEETTLPVHLAVIPKMAQAALADISADHPRVVPIVHGWRHENHAPKGEKKAEFAHPRADAAQETQNALKRMQSLFGETFLPMFVPPWNRVNPALAPVLAAQGYVALSTYLPRKQPNATSGLRQINTHIDPIDWHDTRSLQDEETLLSGIVKTLQHRRYGRTDAREPLGILTHHLVHDPAIWSFTRRCISTLLDGGATPCNLLTMKESLP